MVSLFYFVLKEGTRIVEARKLLTLNEAAAYLGISKLTLYGWTSQRRIDHVKVGRLVKFDRQTLDKLDQPTHREGDRKRRGWKGPRSNPQRSIVTWHFSSTSSRMRSKKVGLRLTQSSA